MRPLRHEIAHEGFVGGIDVYRWHPHIAAGAEMRIPNRIGVEDRRLLWEHMHETVAADSSTRVRPESTAARKRRACRECGRCVKHASGRSIDVFCGALHAFITAAAGRQAKPKSATKCMIEDGLAVLRLHGSGGDCFYSVGRVRWEPQQLMHHDKRDENDQFTVGHRLPSTDGFAP